MPLLITEAEVKSLLTMPLALEAVETSFKRLADRSAENHSRHRLHAGKTFLHYMAAIDTAGGYMGLKIYTSVNRVLRFSRRLRRGRQLAPFLAAVGGFVNEFRESGGVSVRAIEKMNAQCALGRFQLRPSTATLVSRPDAAVGDHPTVRIIEKEERHGMLFHIHNRPLLAAVAGQDHDALLTAIFFKDHASRDAALGRGTFDITKLQKRVELFIGELDLPALGGLTEQRKAERKNEKYREGFNCS